MKPLASAALALLLVLPGGLAYSQDVAYQSPGAPAVYAPSQTELDQLLAPVALYPDPLLGNILAASTYPLEVVALARWLERNPGLSGTGLEQAVAQQPWDPSVKSLASFGGVVKMMNGEIDWMQRLGNAFLADEAAVMDTVQRLRQKARDNGSLADNEHERVVFEDTIIRIEPAQPDTIYVPYYDPAVVYGPWWWPGYPPYTWGAYYWGPWDYFWGGIAFGAVWVSGGWDYHHPHPDWHGRHLVHHDPHHGGPQHVWNHDPAHRIGVPYADNRTHQRYRSGSPGSDPNRQAYRGFDVRPGAHAPSNPAGRYGSSGFFQPAPSQVARPEVAHSQIARPQVAQPQASQPQISRPQVATTQPHALQPMPNPIARQQSARGYESLASRPGGNPIARAPGGGGVSRAPSSGSAPRASSGGGASRAPGGGGGSRAPGGGGSQGGGGHR